MCEQWSGSGARTMVETSDLGQLHDLAHARWVYPLRLGCIFVQRQVGPGPVVVGKARSENEISPASLSPFSVLTDGKLAPRMTSGRGTRVQAVRGRGLEPLWLLTASTSS